MPDTISIRPALRLVDQLHHLDVPVPAAITDALAAHQAADTYQGPASVDLNEAALTIAAKDVPKLLDRAIDATLRRQALHAARGELLDRLGRRVLRALTAATEEVCAGLAPVFDAAATAFTTAYRELPPGWGNAEQLIRSGPDAVAHLQQAQAHAQVLDACRSIRRALAGQTTPAPLEQATTYCKITDTLVADAVLAVRDTGSLGWFGNLLAVDGVTELAWWPTPTAHRAYLNSVPKMRWANRQTGRGIWSAAPEKVPA